jgi:uncharacterized Fe-S cluster-containing radical SAM superfamily protein
MKNKIPFDPLERARKVEAIVMKDLRRKYHRFRYARYYGGIATADQVGCCLLCAYCWNYFKNLNPEKFGKFYSPKEASERILGIVDKKNVGKVRISGAEPILGEKSLNHLIKLIKFILKEDPHLTFILETNGLILGLKKQFCKKLAKFPILVRVSIKGWNENSFEKISGAKKEFFTFPFEAIKNLEDCGVEVWFAVMYEIFGRDGIKILKRKIREIGIRAEVEIEYLEKYPFVTKNLVKRGIKLKKF